MSDPADKSDDLIAELAKLMANTGEGAKPTAPVQPLQRPAPLDPAATSAPAPTPSAAPMPFRIPGMDGPISSRPAAPPVAPPAETRGPVVGAIRIPGMDQPAPVSTSAPVSKFDFGKPVAAPTIRQEPLASLADRIAARAADGDVRQAPRIEPSLGGSAAPRIDLRPVSENKSFGEGPVLQVSRPATPVQGAGVNLQLPPIPIEPAPAPAAEAPAAPARDFHFDFGFGQQAPIAPPAVPPLRAAIEPSDDPIGDLIAAEMAGAEAEPEPVAPAPIFAPVAEAKPIAPAPIPVAQMLRTSGPATAKAGISPIQAQPPRPANSAPIPLKPVTVAPRPADSDRFSNAPSAGLAMRAPANQPLNPPAQPRAQEKPAPAIEADSDPMKEIESLIGEAVRVELSAPGPVRVQAPDPGQAVVDFDAEPAHELAPPPAAPAPVVPPLTTQFAPRRAGLKDDAGTVAAEDAILAAAAATGAPVGRVEPTVGEESRYRRVKTKPAKTQAARSNGLRQYVGMAVAGTLLLAAGLGLYWVLNMGRTANVEGTGAPQLTADATPIKVKPETPVVTEAETARSPVLEKMEASTGASTAPSAEQLVSTDETAGGTVPRDVTATTADSGDAESGLANRKVRTVTVRPDGTIVSGDDAVAGAEELPVDRPNVPTVPGTDSTNLLNDTATASTDPLASAITGGDTTNGATEVAEADIQPVMDSGVVAPRPITFPVRSEATRALSFEAQPTTPTNPVNAVVTGAQTPNGQIDLLAGGQPETTQVAAADPAPASASNAAAFVQIASSLSQAEANGAIRSATAKYGDLFGGNQLMVQKADLGAKGIRYRVRLPAASLADATRICAAIKANGGDCFATNS